MKLNKLFTTMNFFHLKAGNVADNGSVCLDKHGSSVLHGTVDERWCYCCLLSFCINRSALQEVRNWYTRNSNRISCKIVIVAI